MAENLSWLFGAFAFGWGLIFLYLFWISGQERKLRRRIAALSELLEQRQRPR
jgi:hypothetical protein